MLTRIKALFDEHALAVFAIVVFTLCLIGTTAQLNSAQREIATLEEAVAMYTEANAVLKEAGDKLAVYRSANSQLAAENERLQQQCDDAAAQYRMLKEAVAASGAWSPDDLQMVMGVVVAEAGNQSLEGKMAVAQCIYDRYINSYGGDTVYEILTARNQFAAPSDDTTSYPQAYEAVVRVFIFGERVFDKDCIYFYNPTIANPASVAAFEANNEYLGTIGDHVFRSW